MLTTQKYGDESQFHGKYSRQTSFKDSKLTLGVHTSIMLEIGRYSLSIHQHQDLGQKQNLFMGHIHSPSLCVFSKVQPLQSVSVGKW